MSSEGADFSVGKVALAVGYLNISLEGYVASGWNYMTDHYSKFTIATWFSIILHEVSNHQL